MKNISLIFLFLLICLFTHAQSSTLNLYYTQAATPTGKGGENAPNGGFTNVFSRGLVEFREFTGNLQKRYYLREDTVLSESVVRGEQAPFNLKVQSGAETCVINNLTAEKLPYSRQLFDHFYGELFNRLRKKKKGVQEYKDYSCEEYRAKSGDQSLLLYVSKDVPAPGEGVLYEEVSYNGQVILYLEIEDKKRARRIVLQLDSMDRDPWQYEAVAQLLRKKEAERKMNAHLEIDTVEVGDIAPDIYFQDVRSGAFTSFYTYKGDGKYLLIDFWGTWCKPCLAAVPKLKAFLEKHRDKIELLSMSYKDSDLALVRQKIAETGMTWAQGVATERINTLLNPDTNFPGVVLLDDEMRLLLRMDAEEGLARVEAMINRN